MDRRCGWGLEAICSSTIILFIYSLDLRNNHLNFHFGMPCQLIIKTEFFFILSNYQAFGQMIFMYKYCHKMKWWEQRNSLRIGLLLIGQHLVKNDSLNQAAKCVSRDLIEHKIYDLKMASFWRRLLLCCSKVKSASSFNSAWRGGEHVQYKYISR